VDRCRLVARARVAAALTLVAAPAAADGLADLPPPRAIGRAGTGSVSDDGAGAILGSPAGLARRDQARAQVGAAIADDDLTFVADAPAAPLTRDLSRPVLAPDVAGAVGVGPVVVGFAFATTAARDRRMPVPAACLDDGSGRCVDDVTTLFPHRYAGLSSTIRRRTAAVAAAARATDWLAVGASASVSRLELSEHRRGWAGFAGRDAVGVADRDVDLTLTGVDGAVLGASAGVLIAPESASLELAVAVTWGQDARVDGPADAAATTRSPGPQVTTSAPSSALDVASPLIVRGGVRWLGERWTAELGGDLWLFRGVDRPVWTVRGVEVADVAQVRATVDAVPSLLAQHSHAAVRAAVDVELLEGFAWITAGWAWTGAAVPVQRLDPAFADLGGHTAAAGVEVATGGVTLTAGWSHTFGTARTVDGGAVPIWNPFLGSRAANDGSYGGGRDIVGLSLEMTLEIATP